MRENERLDPDALLKAINEDELARRSAHLRIFLGMSAGVGKTYAMLNAARQRMQEGWDVIIGVVETHGRAETFALLADLPILPRKQIEYRDTNLEEMDLDAILARKPKLVIVDELAHSNAPGSRHEKRYQDVLELLDAGIDVYTALNVQHLESRKDAVEAITGVPIRETVPDTILERAYQVELVDVSPTELLKRLSEGKVYLGDKAERAAANFFKEDKLTALREIALRMTAERVDHDLQRWATIKSDAPWHANERLLVAVSHSPYSERIIRATRRLAYNLEAPWIALYVDTGIALNDSDQAQLMKNLNLARDLGAEVITTAETYIPAAVKRVCRQKNVTQVIVGRPTKRWFRELIEGGSLLKRLVKESSEVDIHVIRQDGELLRRPSLIDELAHFKVPTNPLKYWYTLLFLFGLTIVNGVIQDYIGYRAVGFIYLIGVLVVGFFGSGTAVLLAAVISALTWNYGFIPPRFTFIIGVPEDIILCTTYFVAALLTGFLTHRIRQHEKVIREREERTQVLYEVLRDIANSQQKAEFIGKIIQRVGKTLRGQCGVVLKAQSGTLDFNKFVTLELILDEKDRAVALWAFQKQKLAGWSTDTLSQSPALFIPLKGPSESVGVFVFLPEKKVRKLGLEQENLLLSITSQLGASLERHMLSKRLVEAQRLRDSEELHQTLLNSISHEMKTPLTAIMGATAALGNKDLLQDQHLLKELIESLADAGDRLNRMIENLLDMSRINSGVLALKWEWHDVNDLIGVTVNKLSKYLSQHQLIVQMPDNIGLLYCDFRLLSHAIANILLNAVQYTPFGTELIISARRDEDSLLLVIADKGPGISEEFVSHIFDKFYRVPGSPTGGTGLGLSIAKSIVNLHHGSLLFAHNEPHGCRFSISLPAATQPNAPLENEV